MVTRVASVASGMMPECERPKVAQLDAITICQRPGDPVEDGIHHRFYVFRVEVRVLRRDAGHKLGSDHAGIEAAACDRCKIKP